MTVLDFVPRAPGQGLGADAKPSALKNRLN